VGQEQRAVREDDCLVERFHDGQKILLNCISLTATISVGEGKPTWQAVHQLSLCKGTDLDFLMGTTRDRFQLAKELKASPKELHAENWM
jgi:hypothetical protein